MEKQRNKSVAESCRRLLIIFLFFVTQSLYSQTLTSAMLRDLTIVPAEGQQLCVNSEIKFQIIIPYTLPGQIDISMPQEKEGVSFKTLRKVESDSGTKIELWFVFEKTGRFELNPLVVKIRNSRRQIPFVPVTIGINPKEQMPVCVILRGNERNKSFTVTTGQKIKFRVCLQYATQVVRFNWDIPKDSLFIQGQMYEFTQVKQREKVVSDELIPLCDFEWTPLVPGKMDFPAFTITAVAYNGDRVNVPMPKITVNVLKGRSKSQDDGQTFFDSAFEQDFEEQNAQDEELPSTEDSLIAALNKQNDFSVVWIYISAVLLAGLIVVLIILIRRKRKGLSIICGAGVVCALVLFIYCAAMRARKFGESTGAQIFSIPEMSASVKSEIPAGNRVQILSESGEWYYLRFGETEGWCKKDSIIILK